jgi:hypothetical protein
MADLYVVEVNEGVIEASRQGNDFWQLHRPRFVVSGKLVETTPACIVGGKVELGPYGKADAEFMAAHMVENGMPKSAVRVKRAKADPVPGRDVLDQPAVAYADDDPNAPKGGPDAGRS